MKKIISLFALVTATVLMLTSCMPLATIVASTPLPTPQVTDTGNSSVTTGKTSATAGTISGTTNDICIIGTTIAPPIADINDPAAVEAVRPGFQNVNFGGYTFTFASPINATDTWNDYEVYADENSTSIHAASIRKRNEVLKKNYNCNIVVEDIETMHLQNSYATNNGEPDIILTKYNIGSKYMGQYYDFYSLGLDLTKPWWDGNFIDDVTIDGHLFAMLGAFSLTSLDATWVMYFNKTAKECNDNIRNIDFYQYVYSNEWTLDKFYELVKLASVDDGDTNMTLGSADTFGLVSSSLGIRGLYFGAGQSYINKSDAADAKTTFTSAFDGDATEVTNRIIEIYADSASAITDYVTVEKQMKNNAVLFSPDYLRMASKYTENNVNFGILPHPKLNAEQEEYRHSVDDHFIYMCVPTTCTDLTRICQFLEVYAYHSYYTVYKNYLAVYKNYYNTDSDSGEMVAEIIKTRYFDIQYHFNWVGIDSEYTESVKKNTNLIAEHGDRFATALLESVKNYMKNVEEKLN